MHENARKNLTMQNIPILVSGICRVKNKKNFRETLSRIQTGLNNGGMISWRQKRDIPVSIWGHFLGIQPLKLRLTKFFEKG